jgi:hypothetical protein
MLAKVLHNNSVYYSPVFAVSIKGNNCEAVVFDSTFSQLIVLTIFRDTSYNILFMDYNTDKFSINEDKFKSYWNDRNIFKTIKHKKYTPEMLEEARKILRQMKPKEYTTVTSKSDLEALEFNTGSFHDGYILAMKEKNDTLEILFDTSWGSLAILRCKDIIQNDLDIGYVFCHCYMDIDKDGVVAFSINVMSHSKENIFKAKEIQFKPLFEKRIPLKKFDYTVDNHELAIKYDNQAITINKVNNHILDFGERNVLGYIENDEIMQRCFIFSEEIVYSFRQYILPNKKNDHKVAEFQDECKKQGFVFDRYPFDNYFEEYEYDYGELIYSQEYGKFQQLVYIYKILIPILAFNPVWTLVVQLMNPQMEWTLFWIFGIGVPMFTLSVVLIINLIAIVRNKISGNPDHKYIEIYENGLKYCGYNTMFNLAYENITEVEYKKNIVLHTTIGKFTLHKSKNDSRIFELINQKACKKQCTN